MIGVATVAAGIVAAGALGAAVDVKGPETCVALDDVEQAVDAAGGLDPAERVIVVVDPVADPALDDPYVLTVDLDLIGAEPLHRVTPLREIECADVPALVAVLIETQRTLHRVAKAPAPPPVLVEAPPIKRRHRADVAAVDLSWGPCDGPPPLGAFSLDLGVGAALPDGGRALIDMGWRLQRRFGVIGVLDGISGKSAAAYAGVALYAPFDVVDFSIRVLAGGGIGRPGGGLAGADQPCPPSSSTQLTNDGKLTVFREPVGFFASPLVGARARIGWIFVEAGSYWQIGLDPTPGIYIDVGLALFPGESST